jgi:uncharacterized protein (TIGR03437 family)
MPRLCDIALQFQGILLIPPRFWVAGILLVACGGGFAQQNRITKPTDNAHRFTLTGHIPIKATPANDLGRVAPSLKLSYVTLTLTQSDAQKADLGNLLAEQQNPASPNYHRWLTPAQYADRFGVSTDDLSRITQWLRSQGLSILNEAQGRNWIAVSGTAAQIDIAFATEIHEYAAGGETHFANATNPSVPAAIGSMVLSIRGLNDFRMKARSQQPGAVGAVCPGIGQSYCLAPSDVATIYNILPAYSAGIDGTKQKIVIAGQTDINLSDIAQFRSAFNLPVNPPTPLLVPGSPDPGLLEMSGDLAESDLDLEWSGAVAPNANIVFVYSADVMDAVVYAIDQNIAPVLSLSYGLCEQLAGLQQTSTFQTWAQQGNAQGITWFDDAGDNGAADCYTGDFTVPAQLQETAAVHTPASVPEVTGVGGTQFQNLRGSYWSNGGAALSYMPEEAWNTGVDGNPAAGGGGLSTFFSTPSWQVGPGVPANNARNVPDIALNAKPGSDGYVVYTGGSAQIFGGTSCGTPIMAGIAALLNQYLVSTGSQKTAGLGNINPNLYSLAQSKSYSVLFHDVTLGNNTVTLTVPDCSEFIGCTTTQPTVPGYTAGVGYDNVTGLGSVNAWCLITGWNGGTGACAPAVTPPVTPASAGLSLISNLSRMSPSDVAFLTATATADDGITTPQGVVQFSVGATEGAIALGAVTLAGAAGISTATLPVTWDELPSGSTTITATYQGSSTTDPVTSSVNLTTGAVSSSNGTPVIQGLTDAASFQQQYSPGMIMSVFGTALAPAGTAESASSLPLPVTMAGVAATVNGVEAPLYYVSPTQLNIQVPWQTAVGSRATLAVNNNGAIPTVVSQFLVSVASPGIFTDATNTIVCGCSAVRGQTSTLYLAGPGVVSPAIATGSAPVLSTPLASLPEPANTTVTVGGVTATTSFIGIPYYLVGVVQINFEIPSGIPTGPQPVVVNVNGTLSHPALLNVTN